jgi:hypothetical protein
VIAFDSAVVAGSIVRVHQVEIEDAIVDRAVPVRAGQVTVAEFQRLAAGRTKPLALGSIGAAQQRLLVNVLDEAAAKADVQGFAEQHVAALAKHRIIFGDHLIPAFGTIHA